MSDRKLLRATFLVSLALHVLLGAATVRLEVMPRFTPAAMAAEPSVALLLVDDPSAGAEPPAPQPTQYTEIPERLQAERPERADFLAMHHSRAADRLPGGQAGEQPGTEREAEFPQVAIMPENLAGAEAVFVEPPVLSTPQRAPRSRQEQAAAAAQAPAGAEVAGPGDLQVPRRQDADAGPAPREGVAAGDQSGEFADWLAKQPAPSLLREGRQQPPGDRGFDFRQLDQGRIGVNTNLDGVFSLNTYEWNFAPWMRRFVNDLHRAWIPPFAYHMNVIDGYTRIFLVVEPDGRPSRLEIIDRQGHDSLHTASVAALRTFAPYAPLPPDFPEDRLEITLQLHYPAWNR